MRNSVPPPAPPRLCQTARAGRAGRSEPDKVELPPSSPRRLAGPIRRSEHRYDALEADTENRRLPIQDHGSIRRSGSRSGAPDGGTMIWISTSCASYRSDDLDIGRASRRISLQAVVSLFKPSYPCSSHRIPIQAAVSIRRAEYRDDRLERGRWSAVPGSPTGSPPAPFSLYGGKNRVPCGNRLEQYGYAVAQATFPRDDALSCSMPPRNAVPARVGECSTSSTPDAICPPGFSGPRSSPEGRPSRSQLPPHHRRQ